MSRINVRSAVGGAAKALANAAQKPTPAANVTMRPERLTSVFRKLRYDRRPNIHTTRMSGLNDPRKPVREKVVHRPRMLLCNWAVSIMRPGKLVKDNEVMFKVDGKMTKFDIKNYLQTIYNIPVEKVETSWTLGKSKRHPSVRGLFIKRSDFKRAYITLGGGHKFRYPDDPLEYPPDEDDIIVPDYSADVLDVE